MNDELLHKNEKFIEMLEGDLMMYTSLSDYQKDCFYA
jgi:hypothetical protein